jgi:hypothetical protein
MLCPGFSRADFRCEHHCGCVEIPSPVIVYGNVAGILREENS